MDKYKKIANIADLLDAETSSADAEKSKPYPDIFQAALARRPMTPRVNVVLLAMGLAALLPGVVSQAAPGETYETLFKTCYTSSLPDRVIASCSLLIRRRLASGEDLATAFKNRGNAHDDKGDHGLAIDDYGQALSINPQDADAFNSRGAALIALGRYERAVLDFDQATRLNPASPMAFGNRCFAKALLGQFDEALADCNEALRLNADNPGALAARGFVHLMARRADQAIADYNASLSKRPNDPYAMFCRGLARYLKGDTPGGDRDIAEARERNPELEAHMAKLGLRQQDFR